MRPCNIAHRGGAGLFPENTRAAFEHAMTLGADGAELDVQLSADGVPVVHHDGRLDPGICRDCAGRWLTGTTPRIRDISFAALQSYDVGRPAPGSAYASAHPLLTPVDGARIPALAEIVALAKLSRFHLFIELKSDVRGEAADAEALADAVLAPCRDFLDHVIFVGFDWRGLLRVRRQAPAARCWFTTDRLAGDPRSVIDGIAAAGASGWFAHHDNATAAAVAHARARGLKVCAWTVNDPSEMATLMTLDAICTDRPDLLKALEQSG